MTRILFICLGNICRSPMAEYVMKDLTSKAGLSEQFEIASAATSAWEIGNPVYPPARQKLAEHGIDCNGKTARQMTRLDYARYDHLIGMDESNLCDILRLVGGDPQHKVSLLMAHTDHPREVADPWFTGDFEATWQDILEGCTALLEELRSQQIIIKTDGCLPVDRHPSLFLFQIILKYFSASRMAFSFSGGHLSCLGFSALGLL